MNSGQVTQGPLRLARLERGILRVVGADRVALLHRLSTQDLRPLMAPGRVAQTLFATAQGRVLAWSHLISQPDDLLLVCDVVRVARLKQWIETYTIMEDVTVEDVSEQWTYVQVFGPEAAAALGVAKVPEAGVIHAKFGAEPNCGCGVLMALPQALGSGLCGLVAQAAWPWVQAKLEAAGAQLILPEALEVLRLEAGMPSSSHELAGEANPLEMRLGADCISWKKGCYIGQEVISRLDSYDKVARLLMGFSAPIALPVPPEAAHRLCVDGRPICKITSCAITPEGSIGLALVKRNYAKPGPAQLNMGDAGVDIVLQDCPFWAIESSKQAI